MDFSLVAAIGVRRSVGRFTTEAEEAGVVRSADLLAAADGRRAMWPCRSAGERTILTIATLDA